MPETGTAGFRILVVVPTLGQRLPTLARTLESVRSQTGVAVDLLLVTTRRSTELVQLAAMHDARVIEHPGHISAAVNAGFASADARHRYAAWLGDDDLLRAQSLATSSAALEGAPAATVAYGACDYIDLAGNLLFTRRPPPGAPFLLQMVPGQIKQESCLFRLEAWRQVGGLDESLRWAMDLDVLLKLRRQGPFVSTRQVLAAFCWHAGSLTISNRNVSLQEAQKIQGGHARGVVKWSRPLWQRAVRMLILAVDRNVNRRLQGRART